MPLSALLAFAIGALPPALPYDAVLPRQTNAVPEKCLSRFLEYPPGPGKLGFPRCLWENPFPRNPDFWLKNVDFSCASPWNDAHGPLRAGTAISKRHIVYAKHFPLALGTRIAFVGVNGDVSHYALRAARGVDGTDIMVGLLDYELTPDVHPAKVLPSGFEKRLVEGSKWPVVTFNRREQAYLSEITVVRADSRPAHVRLVNGKASNPAWRTLGGNLVGGDSGNPAFLLYQGHPILVYCVYYGEEGRGPPIHEYLRAIQQAMDELCPGYRLEPFAFTP